MPNRRPFDLLDPSISFKLVDHETVPVWLAGVLAIILPGVLIFIISLLLVPGPTVPSDVPKSLIWRRKLWEWYAGWAGLAMSSALAFFVISAMKNLFGKPRPHTLAACLPGITSLSDIDYEPYRVGGFGNIGILVSAEICTQTDKSILMDTFRSFPSGHSASSAAGLIYFSLFLASKLAITIPFLASNSRMSTTLLSAFPSRLHAKPTLESATTETGYPNESASNASPHDPLTHSPAHNNAQIGARSQSAAPPLYLVVLALAPTALAVYISATRFSDFYHFGFDILFGFAIGTAAACLSFRWYHLPIRQGAGWAWGPRSTRRAWWAGVGVGSYAHVGDEESGDGDVR